MFGNTGLSADFHCGKAAIAIQKAALPKFVRRHHHSSLLCQVFFRQYRDFYRYPRVKMSHDYVAFPASGTKIAYLGHTKQNVAFFRFLHGRVYALFRYGSAPPVSIRILSQLPSSRLPITRVSAQLICGIFLPWNKFLPTTGSFFVWIVDCPLSATAPGGGRLPAASGTFCYNCTLSITVALSRLSTSRLKAAVMEYWEIDEIR